jgi:hypothetical protein
VLDATPLTITLAAEFVRTLIPPAVVAKSSRFPQLTRGARFVENCGQGRGGGEQEPPLAATCVLKNDLRL